MDLLLEQQDDYPLIRRLIPHWQNLRRPCHLFRWLNLHTARDFLSLKPLI